MFAKYADWNNTMSRAGWTIDNLHMLQPIVDVAVKHKRMLQKHGGNYFDRRIVAIKEWWRLHATELVERDPTMTGAALTTKCRAYYDRVHKTMIEFRARSCMKDPAIQFPAYFAAIANRFEYSRQVARAVTELGAIADVARSASSSSDSPI